MFRTLHRNRDSPARPSYNTRTSSSVRVRYIKIYPNTYTNIRLHTIQLHQYTETKLSSSSSNSISQQKAVNSPLTHTVRIFQHTHTRACKQKSMMPLLRTMYVYDVIESLLTHAEVSVTTLACMRLELQRITSCTEQLFYVVFYRRHVDV